MRPTVCCVGEKEAEVGEGAPMPGTGGAVAFAAKELYCPGFTPLSSREWIIVVCVFCGVRLAFMGFFG